MLARLHTNAFSYPTPSACTRTLSHTPSYPLARGPVFTRTPSGTPLGRFCTSTFRHYCSTASHRLARTIIFRLPTHACLRAGPFTHDYLQVFRSYLFERARGNTLTFTYPTPPVCIVSPSYAPHRLPVRRPAGSRSTFR